MFENLQQSLESSTGRFERNVSRLNRRTTRKLSEWTAHDYRAGAVVIVAAAVLTVLQWIAVPFQLLARLVAGRFRG